MQVRSTLNIDSKIFDKITIAADLCNISRTKLINLLFITFHERSNGELKSFQSVSYQKSNEDTRWHKFHINYRADVYEICIDLRKWHKCSVSKILTLAVEKYIDEIIFSLQTGSVPINRDNYVVRYNYSLRKFNETEVYPIVWGIVTQEALPRFFSET